MNGVLEFNVENILAACGSLIALGIDYCMIAKGLKTFKLNSNVGRFNLYDLNGVKIILDYGHNVAGYKEVLKAIDRIKVSKVIGVIGAPGDRVDSAIEGIGNICSKYLDEIIIKEDKDRRGRKKGEVAEILKVGIDKNKRKGNVKVCLDEIEAFKIALSKSKPSDIVVVFYEDLNSMEEVIKECKNHTIKLDLANL